MQRFFFNKKYFHFIFKFENEVKKEKQWVESTSRNWPHYSDVTGNVSSSLV